VMASPWVVAKRCASVISRQRQERTSCR
jgi:hypothetical protein